MQELIRHGRVLEEARGSAGRRSMSGRRARSAGALALAAILAVGGCDSSDPVSKQQMGTVGGGAVGGVLGGVVGSEIGGGGAGTVVGALAGAGLGAWLGNQLGSYLDEQDQEQAAEAARAAMVTGSSQTWRNPETGASGRAEVVGDGDFTGTGRPCRTVRQVVVLPDGTERVEDITACQGPEGWEVV